MQARSADRRAVIRALSLRDFRNFERSELRLADDGLVIVGENGHGKTNLLEAAYYLSLLRSVRGARDVDVVRFGAPGFYVEGDVSVPDDRRIAIGFERATRRKRVRVNDAPSDRLSDALGALPVVMFSPSDVELVAGSPTARRRFLDIMLALTSREYLSSLQLYRAALERRNAALRDASRAGRSAASIEVWEDPLATHGAVLLAHRRAWVHRVHERFGERCTQIGEHGAVELRYATSLEQDGDPRAALAQALAMKRGADLRFGVTRVGPHRDDLIMLLDQRELRVFGSAGQQRTAAIALRTLEAETLGAARGVSPVFLLDDPFAELDIRRSERVLALLRDVGLGQTILAVPRDAEIPPEFSDLQRVRVVEGRIE